MLALHSKLMRVELNNRGLAIIGRRLSILAIVHFYSIVDQRCSIRSLTITVYTRVQVAPRISRIVFLELHIGPKLETRV